MSNDKTIEWIAFCDNERVAKGRPRAVATRLQAYWLPSSQARLLIFDSQTGHPVELDLRGSIAEVLARLPAEVQAADGAGTLAQPGAGPGPSRPRLGVVAREVTLLPRHWDWLASQQGGASVTPRKLVEQTLRSNGAADRQRTARAAAYRFMHAIAGDATGFEEASRALFSGDLRGLSQCMSAWPGDIRAHILEMLASDSAANESRGQRLQCFIDEVWNHGDASAAAKYLTPHYTIHHDPGDPWEKKTLNRAEFEERVVHSRAPFPDQRFDILQMAECAAGVMMTWTWCGTHLGDLPGFLASGRQINMSGATLYCFDDERISGHWQVTDRLGVFMQLRQGAAG